MEQFWDYFWFILIIVGLCAIWFLLNRWDKRTKNRHKKEAYRILDAPEATEKEIMHSIKMLRLYGGRFRKDKEFLQIINKLIDKLEAMGVSTRISGI